MDSVPKCEPGELRGVDVLIVVSRPRRGGRRWLAAARTLVGVAVPNAEFRSPKGSSARSQVRMLQRSEVLWTEARPSTCVEEELAIQEAIRKHGVGSRGLAQWCWQFGQEDGYRFSR